MPPPTVARRAFLIAPWRETVATDAAVQTAHPLAPQIIIETLLSSASDAATEATRQQALRGVRRDVFTVSLQLDATTAALDLGQVVTVTHDRFGLTAGKDFRIIGVEPDAENEIVQLTLWG